MSRKYLMWIVVAAIAAGGFFGYQYWRDMQSALPKGIASGNGRIEAKLVDIAAKEALRVKEILVDEGALVKPGDVLVRMDTATLESQLAEARLNVAATGQKAAITKASIARSKAQIELAKIEVKRSTALVAERAGSQRELDVRRTALQTTSAGLQEEEAKLRTNEQEVKVAEANVATIQTRIDDATLKSPVTGRVLYRLAEVGEVLAAGGKALTLVNLNDVYMEIFLPSEQAAKLKNGAEAQTYPGRSAGPRLRWLCEFRVARGAIHPKAGRDEERARKADVPRQDPRARGDGRIPYRRCQNWRARCRLCEGRRIRRLGQHRCGSQQPLREVVPPKKNERRGPKTPASLRLKPQRAGEPVHAGDSASNVSTVAAVGAPVVSIKGVTHRYGATLALDGLSLDIPSGRMVGVIGPDGVGKSTLLALVAGSKQMQQGKVTVLGGDIADAAPPARRLPAHRLYAPGPRQEPLFGTQRRRRTSTSWRGSSAFPPRSAPRASSSCSTRRALAPFPTAPPASFRAA